MAFESVRSYVQLASGLGELTRAKAMEAAQGLLALPGAEEVTRRAVQASTLADQLLEVARANRATLLSLIQSEVESALKRADVARVADVEAARTALGAVTKEMAELRSLLVATGSSAVAGASRSSLGRSLVGSGAVSTAARPVAATTEPATTATSTTATTTSTPARKAASATKATAKRATARKAASAKKATAKKATAKRTTATKAASAKKATAKRATATKATTTKAAQ